MPSPLQTTFHLLVDPPADGVWNMAVDEALLTHVAGGDPGVWLRFYQWREPTLSLGYFQSADRWSEHVRGDCAVVRRQTGGGAILHDRELTYSLALPPEHPLTRSAQELYVRVHQALIAALRRFTIEADLWPDREAASRDEPFLCFLRRGPGDVVIRSRVGVPRPVGAPRSQESGRPRVSDYKICGSAQRRRRGALLLHGSLLLSTSPVAPQILGLQEVTGSELSPAAAREAWLEAFSGLLGRCPPRPGDLPDGVRDAASRLAREKYSTVQWTARR